MNGTQVKFFVDFRPSHKQSSQQQQRKRRTTGLFSEFIGTGAGEHFLLKGIRRELRRAQICLWHVLKVNIFVDLVFCYICYT